MLTSDEKNDYWEYFWDNGQLYFKGCWKKGVKHGPWESYYPTGKILGQGYYSNGLRDGKFFRIMITERLNMKGILKMVNG